MVGAQLLGETPVVLRGFGMEAVGPCRVATSEAEMPHPRFTGFALNFK